MTAEDPDRGTTEDPTGEGPGWSRRRGRRQRTRRGGLRRLDRPRKIVLRDFLIYELKLLLDGAKSFAITWAAVGALVVDMIRPGETPGHRFYGVMRLGERLDRWLSLYGVAEAAETDADGMFGVSRAGSPTLLGKVEALAHRIVVGTEGDFDDDADADAADATGAGEASDAGEATDEPRDS